MMKSPSAAFLVLFLSWLTASGAEGPSFDVLIKKLGSGNFKDREMATKALAAHPEAEALLREAMRSADLETRRRILQILDKYRERLVRELGVAAQEGHFQAFVQTFASWQRDKYEQGVCRTARDLARVLVRFNEKQTSQKIEFFDSGDRVPILLNKNRLTESVIVQVGGPPVYIAAGDVDADGTRQNPSERKPGQGSFAGGSFMVVARSVRLVATERHVIFAGGSVELSGDRLRDTLIVSAGDVRLNCELFNSLVIARGRVVSTGNIEANRIICGKWFEDTTERKASKPNLIEEYQHNPLGFIRWHETLRDRRFEEAQEAVKSGRIERFIELAAGWPDAKDEQDIWWMTWRLTKALALKHRKMDGKEIDLNADPWRGKSPSVFVAKRITEATEVRDDRLCFVRTGEIDIQPERRKTDEPSRNWLSYSPVIIAAGGVRMPAWRSHYIFAGGPIRLDDGGIGVGESVIVSAADITLNCDLSNSLVIARGKVNCANIKIKNCRIIGGKSVIFDKKNAEDCIIAENEPNPLGFVRWRDSAIKKGQPQVNR